MSELALAHLFAVSRFIGTANVEMRQGKWNKKAYTGKELCGSQLGLVGLAGQRVSWRRNARLWA